MPVEVWELWGLDLSCLSRFGSSRRAGCLTALIDRVDPLKNLSRAGSPLSESSGSCGALGEVCGRVLGVVGELWARFGSSLGGEWAWESGGKEWELEQVLASQV